ncbi:MAG TPA: response regulator [Patescibacteria group bacterium]|nr:response regulator [Patescibacteria group bacterium]
MSKIAIMNSSKEVTGMLKDVLEDSGFETVDVYTYKLKNKEVDIDKFLAEHKPDVILYDIAIPYQENFRFFKSVVKRVKNIPFIVTTTNKEALDKLVGKTEAFEIIGKPFDLMKLVEMVTSATKA